MESQTVDKDLVVGDEDYEEEVITAEKVLEYLEIAWRNEICAPEILQHQADMLDLMLVQIKHMEENMKDLDKNDFRFVVHQMELDRVRYVISAYLRSRVQKIETYTQYILNEESEKDAENKRLSSEETEFAKEYLENLENCLNQIAQQYIPSVQRTSAEQRVIRPNLMSHVFIKASVSVPAVIVGVDDEEVDLVAGSQHIIPYQLVAELIQKNQAKLI